MNKYSSIGPASVQLRNMPVQFFMTVYLCIFLTSQRQCKRGQCVLFSHALCMMKPLLSFLRIIFFLVIQSLCSVRRCLFILLYVYFNLCTVNITQFNPRVAKLYSIHYLSMESSTVFFFVFVFFIFKRRIKGHWYCARDKGLNLCVKRDHDPPPPLPPS